KYIKSYEIWLKFNDGTEGAVDLGPTITNDHRDIFRELTDPAQFMKFKLDADTIIWENGLDLAPEYLYDLTINAVKKAS
ncbi:MAG: DUF2442 domain-containing protein, partial [bacterium]|nr:DUF2442 domain-containing protein [bacterium]